MTSELDPYRTLGVRPTASLLEIARARRRLAKLYHPDLAAGEAAADEMGRINVAWTLLADAEARAAWDRAHGVTSSGQTPPSSTWAEWACARAEPPRPRTEATNAGAAWWVLAAVVLFVVVIVAGGILGSLDRPDGMVDPVPWLQDNLDP